MPATPIELNSASVKEIAEALDVSTEVARNVIQHRAEVGGFSSIDELAQVPGFSSDALARARRLAETGSLKIDDGDAASAQPWRLLVRVVPVPEVKEERHVAVRLQYAPHDAESRVSERHEVPLDRESRIQVERVRDEGEIQATVENRQGQILVAAEELETERDEQERELRAVVRLDTENLEEELRRLDPEKSDAMRRGGHFRVLKHPDRRFDDYHLAVDLVDSDDKARAVHALLQTGEETAPATATRRISLGDTDLTKLVTRFDLSEADVKFDGKFDFSRKLPASENGNPVRGWLWLLNGPQLYVGYRMEEQPEMPRHNLIILLPEHVDDGEDVANGEDTEDDDIGKTKGGTKDCCGGQAVRPMDVDEDHLLRDPQLFHDDPGPFCDPFDNPVRILGERSFQTILRVEQPEIASTAANRPNYALLLPDEPQMATPRTAMVAMPTAPQMSSLWLRRFQLEPLPGFSTIACFPQPRQWAPMRSPVSSRNLIDWEGDPTRNQALSVAGGHILEWRVQWRSNGYSLGDVKRALTLAPRQVRRIVKVDWERSERARRAERTVATDEIEQGMDRSMTYDTAVSSALSEWSEGRSEARTTGAAGGIGFSLGPVVVGGGAAHGRSSSEAWQEGGREVTASEEQSLRDSIRQYGDALRQMESTVVTEAEQHEAVEGVSEIVRNPNYCHSLSILYYEVLRHLRVDTTLAGVQECLFVPFTITPITAPRLLRWRDAIRPRLRRRELRWVLKYAEKVVAVKQLGSAAGSQSIDEAWGDVPAGSRASQPLHYLSGSLYVRLGIERPATSDIAKEVEEGVIGERLRALRESAVAESLKRFARILGRPVEEIARQQVRADEADLDAYFRREVAPTMARNWVEHLEFHAGDNVVLEGVDFTLASRYHHKGTMRIDFTVPRASLDAQDLTREKLEEMVIRAGEALPEGSVADCLHGHFDYETAIDRSRVRSNRRARSLVRADDGSPSAEGAILTFSLTGHERQNLREEIMAAYDQILEHVNDHLHYYHKVIWWSMDRDELYTILDGFSVSESDNRSIASVVQRRPLGILGNSLIFRVAAGAFLGIDDHESPEKLVNYYRDEDRPREPMRISLPTNGVYAQALMDQCHACEEHQGSTEWVLSDDEPELGEFPPDMLKSRRSEVRDLEPTSFPQSIISLQNAPQLPQTQGLEAALTLLGQSDAFRDMAGLEGTQQAANAALKQAATLAGNFGKLANALDSARREDLARQMNQFRAALERAIGSGIMKEEDAQKVFAAFASKAAGALDDDKATANEEKKDESEKDGDENDGDTNDDSEGDENDDNSDNGDDDEDHEEGDSDEENG